MWYVNDYYIYTGIYLKKRGMFVVNNALEVLKNLLQFLYLNEKFIVCFKIFTILYEQEKSSKGKKTIDFLKIQGKKINIGEQKLFIITIFSWTTVDGYETHCLTKN